MILGSLREARPVWSNSVARKQSRRSEFTVFIAGLVDLADQVNVFWSSSTPGTCCRPCCLPVSVFLRSSFRSCQLSCYPTPRHPLLPFPLQIRVSTTRQDSCKNRRTQPKRLKGQNDFRSEQSPDRSLGLLLRHHVYRPVLSQAAPEVGSEYRGASECQGDRVGRVQSSCSQTAKVDH